MECVLALESDEEHDTPKTGIKISADARKELILTLREREDLDFKGDGDMSRRTGFEGSVGNSTHRSDNTDKRARRHKERALVNTQLNKEKADLEKEKEAIQAKLRAYESLLANKGLPPSQSGNPTAGETPQSQDLEPDGSAAGQM